MIDDITRDTTKNANIDKKANQSEEKRKKTNRYLDCVALLRDNCYEHKEKDNDDDEKNRDDRNVKM